MHRCSFPFNHHEFLSGVSSVFWGYNELLACQFPVFVHEAEKVSFSPGVKQSSNALSNRISNGCCRSDALQEELGRYCG